MKHEKKNNAKSIEIQEQNKKIEVLIKENESFKTLSERLSKLIN